MHPLLPGAGADLLAHDLRAVARPGQQFQKFLLGVGARPAGVDQDPLALCHLAPHDVQNSLLFCADGVKIAHVQRFYQRFSGVRVQNRRLVIGLVRVGGEQIEVGREDAPCGLSACFQDFPQDALDAPVLLGDLLFHIQRDRDLLIVGKVLAHIRQGEESGLLQQKPGVDQRGDSGQLPGSRLSPVGPAVDRIILLVLLIGVLHHAVLRVKFGGGAVGLAVLHHKVGADPVEQVEDAGGVAVDEGGGHPDDPVRHREDLRHGVALAAVVVVLVEFVHNAAVKFPFVLALDVGAHGIAPAGPHGGVVPIRVFRDRPDLLQRRLMLRLRKMLRRKAAVDPAIGA